jgi:general nucleoside transport system ATP-binding protein
VLIEFHDIHKYYGAVQANAEIDLTLEPGRIYGLLGENGAGKSTLMRILAGHTRPTRGRLLLNGKAADGLTPAEALGLGVGMLAQDPLDFPALKVWENFSLGKRKRRRETVTQLQDLADRFHVRLPPEEKVAELTVGERQQLELLRLLDLGVKVLILDEPTTGISVTQKAALFGTLRRLAAEPDRTIIFVSHKLSEVEELCQEVIVLRRGRLVARVPQPLRAQDLIALMFGPEPDAVAETEARPQPLEQALLTIDRLHLLGEKFALENLSLEIRPGEILGLAGLEGNGQELLLRGLAGLTRVVGGRFVLDGSELQGRPYLAFRRAGVHFVPAARLEEGLFPELSVADHVNLALPGNGEAGATLAAEEAIRRFHIQAEPSTPARTLSGGNQQRLLLSLIPPRLRLLLLEHPTRGLDLGATRQVWQHLVDRCGHGTAILFSSADLDEIFAYSDRVLVFYNRRLVAELPAHATSLEAVGRLMAGQERTV